jgi:hypothetical protein
MEVVQMHTGLNNHNERAHALLSASSAHRWLACPPSAVAAEAYPNQDTDFTREGTLAHEVAEAVASNKTWRPPAGVDQEMIECAAGYRDYIQEQIKGDEAVILLEQRVDFSPWVPDGFGTCDCIILQGDTMIVIDYKYGVGVPVSAIDNPQMKLYALGALNDFGFVYDVKKFEMHIYQPRINNVSVDKGTVEELISWADKTVKSIAEKAAKGEGEFCAGSHCKFCPHAGKCRELTKTCTDFVETHDLRVAIPKLAPHEITEVLAMEPVIALWLKRVKEQALIAMLNGEDIPGYKVVEGKLGNRKWIDELKVANVLSDAGFNKDDFTEIKLLSPSQMDKAIGKKKVAELLDELIERAPGAPQIAPESDKRPVYDRLAEAQNDFN